MNSRWTGPRLCDVLLRAGPKIQGNAHVAFACHFTGVQEDTW